MRLKRVRIQGFKTFADRTEVNLDGGLVAVVGPNGCGKSNIVDAILWGLGEGNSRHLRAHTGQDVIFNGSLTRKAVGFAEVTLIFDNEDGALPIDSSEVMITRRLNRAGESSYEINKTACRQRDVLELLADSGLGRAGYAIVTQKEIDQALAASAEDRRAWIDEAAGVQRYRARKVDSLRRLQQAESHLERVADILSELEGQREPLREEAEQARRYRAAYEALKSIEAGLLAKEIAQADSDLAETAGKTEALDELLLELGSRILSLESKVEQAKQARTIADGTLDHRRRQYQQAERQRADAETERRLAEQRLASLVDVEAGLATEMEMSATQIRDAEADVDTATQDLERAKGARDQLTEQAAGAGSAAVDLKNKLDELDRRLSDARGQQIAAVKAQAQAAQISTRIKEIERELAGVDRALPDLDAALKAADAEYLRASEEWQNARRLTQDLERSWEALREQREKDAATIRRRTSEEAALKGKKQVLESTIESHEGLTQGARAVLDAVKARVLADDYVPVGEVIETAKANALAIETALGGAVNDLIVPSDREAKEAIAHLKEFRAGRATFQPLTLMKPTRENADLKSVLRATGIVGRAADLVECDARFRPVIESLLGRVVIAEDLDCALQHAKTGGWSRLVTLQGEVVQSSGAVTGGQSSRQNYGLVQRKADLEQVERDLTALRNEGLAAEDRERAFEVEAERIRQKRAELESQITQAQVESEETRSFRDALSSEFQSTTRQRSRLAEELQKLESPLESIEEVDVAEIELERDSLIAIVAATSADAEVANQRLVEANAGILEANARLETANRRLATAIENERRRQTRQEGLGPERDRLTDAIGKHGEAARALDVELAALSSAITEGAQEKAVLEQEIQLAEHGRKEAELQKEKAQAERYQAELVRARAETKRANAAQRLMEEYGLTENEAIEAHREAEVPADAAGTVSRLRRDIRAMGDVNVGAIEAFERLTVRYDELHEQRQDILEGIEQVQGSIRELDKLTRDRFVDTFTRVQEAYRGMFGRVFSGGAGELSLTTPDNILESGIEIDVTLPGKRKQPLALLSGGERALCATAFLFALLEVKPSPLVVLDEVDAPLDGRNVERFADLLVDFAKNIQFIVITHNPITIERAPIWLGVTMQEPGVSTLVPARMPTLASA